MAVLYVVAAWLIMQVAEVLIALAKLPDGIGTTTLVLLAIGFPIALVFSWFYELTPEGLSLEKDVQTAESITQVTGRRMDFIVISLLCAGLILFAYDKWWIGPPPEKSIAVLAFENMSGDPEQEYFSDGMSEEILNLLAQLPELTVISSSSAFSFKGKDIAIPTVAEQLKVAHVVEGSVRKEGNRVRITVQLIDGRTDEHLWAEVYDRDLSAASLFDIQADIARRVAGALRVRVSSVERGRISGRSTESRVAYDLYLRASQLRYGRDRSANTAAVELLKQALALDPGFAQARAKLAHVYVIKALTLGYPRREWADSGIALARRAIDDDPSLPLGHYALATAHGTLGQLTDAVEEFEKVLELQPSAGPVLAWLSWIQYQRGRPDEAVDLVRRAFRIDPREWALPFNMAEYETNLGNYRNAERWVRAAEARAPNHPYLSSHRVLILLAEGKTSEAVEEAERNLSEDPQDLVEALSMAAEALLRAGNFEKALQYLEEVYRIAPEGWDVVGRSRRTLHGWALLKLGDTERGLALLEEVVQEAHRLVDQGNEEPVLRRELAAVYAAMGDKQRAYEWLERAIDSGWRRERMYVSPLFESLHGEERFEQLMNRIDADLERMKARVEREGLAPALPSEN
jgi:TolB-like protein/predicted Zn-dependent protease